MVGLFLSAGSNLQMLHSSIAALADVISPGLFIYGSREEHRRTEAMMSDTAKTQQDLAREALEALDQAFAYYIPEEAVHGSDDDFVEYYEYAAAA
ncbi:hypothetical protein GR167_17060 [Rhodobacteraceae bacterium GS-10]|uniref:Uncharacterized protein n=1 Tax=Thalassovita mangrovi TaxID=2692236 RepID=A0A6L8LV70_9RHOB|nr:hypothetical protein [Thalassovita mangrovi]